MIANILAVLLISCIGIGGVLIWTNIRQQKKQARIVAQLQAEQRAYQEQIAELNSITNDLRAHIRSQQALEESLRAITGSLRLNDVLRQILDSMAQMLGPERVDAAAVSLRNGDRYTNQVLVLDDGLGEGWVEHLAQPVCEARGMLLLDHHTIAELWPNLHALNFKNVIALPLLDEDGQVMGSLSAVSTKKHAFSSADGRHLNAFAIQARVAIRNAELHSQVRSQWAMLEAVLHDLGEGLVIYDAQAGTVWTNPVAERYLSKEADGDNQLRQELEKLVADVRNGDRQTLMRELHGAPVEGQDQPVYHAIASRVRVNENAISHVAVVLHDITRAKADERDRARFISMVSHELRNPLHTLNGFLNVVLQGRAGELNPVQQDFLKTAEEQVAKLQGRINELLDFNRLEAGRMRLEFELASLSAIAATTVTPLALQAEQARVELINNIPDDLPELYMDSARIGQVLTNLIENAIKATAPGGSIHLSSSVKDDQIEVLVRDTGVGIDEEECKHIFEPFYSSRSRSRFGEHLGLGLAICQQIVQGHKGRIWVESKQHEGSTFGFSLPLNERGEVKAREVAGSD